MKNSRLGVALGLALVLAAVGCSGAAEGTDEGGGGAGGEVLTGNGFSTTKGGEALGSSGLPTLSASSSGAGDVGGVTPGSACATSSASVEAPPVHLVFMIDRSGSMGNSKHGQNEDVRWKPVVSGLEAFFADPANANVRASIAFFGQGNDEAAKCSAATYATPAVSMRALPDSGAFAAALDDASPGGGTPTRPALEGAIQYAQQIKASLPAGEKVAIVLATDGNPNDCSSTPENVAAKAAAVAATIPTYVIGVGPEATKLDTIANGGGTGDAIMIATSNPAQVSADLRAAVGQIKAAQLGCTYPLPAPPAGQALDVNAVNVDYTPAKGATQTLTYSADCSNANGWRYDDPTAPKEVVMCAASCAALKADVTGGKLDIVFGCAISAPPGSELPGGGVK